MNSIEEFKATVRKNVGDFGFHVTIVSGNSQVPSFAYTIGLTSQIGFEVFIAGCSLYDSLEIHSCISSAAKRLLKNDSDPAILKQEAHPSWVKSILLGAYDYYQAKSIRAFQLIPPSVKESIDRPDTRTEVDLKTAPWIWLVSDWAYAIPKTAIAITDQFLLAGQPALEAVRWEVDTWEIFSMPGPDVEKHEIRTVPLSVILKDSSNLALLDLAVGGAAWRFNVNESWVAWRRREE